MTEREKARARVLIVGALVAMFVMLAGSAMWLQLSKPMTPIVIEFANSTEVRWGNRFAPFVYHVWNESGNEEILLPGVGRFTNPIGDEKTPDVFTRVDHNPPEVNRRLLEGWAILKEHGQKRERETAATTGVAAQPQVTPP